jgi:crossover junction endodeoxyribonuclease RuvC
MRILGLDPGSHVCGYGVIETGEPRISAPGGNQLTYVECGVLTAPADLAMEERLAEIARGLRDVLAELAPMVVAVEDVFTHSNVRSGLALAQARGMVLAVVGLSGLRAASYAPALIKKTVTGSGRADKDQIARMVQHLVGLRALPRPDASDALAVAITHARTTAPTAARVVSAVTRPARARAS